MNLRPFCPNRLALATALLLSLLTTVGFAQETRTYSRADFINIDGSTLADKIERAVRQFKAAKSGDSVWLAYHYPPRSGASTGPFSNLIYRDDDGVRLERRDDPQSAAVFLLADTSGSRPVFTRVKTLNLTEPYLFENRPVYWLGNVSADESITQIEQVMRANAEDKAALRGALRAISLHDSPRAVVLLKDTAQKQTVLELQRVAIQNLARISGKDALDALIDLYENSGVEAVKTEVIAALARRDERRASEKLLAIAKNDSDPKMRQAAIKRLGQNRQVVSFN